MTVFMGDDWAEEHHDVYLMEDDKKLVSRRRPEGPDATAMFHRLVANHIADAPEVVVGIETDRRCGSRRWSQQAVRSGDQPLAASRDRDRHSVGGAKSDAGHAKMLADVVRVGTATWKDMPGLRASSCCGRRQWRPRSSQVLRVARWIQRGIPVSAFSGR